MHSFTRMSGNTFPEKSAQKDFENLKRSLQICNCPYVVVARSVQILKENWFPDLYRFSRKAQYGLPFQPLTILILL